MGRSRHRNEDAFATGMTRPRQYAVTIRGLQEGHHSVMVEAGRGILGNGRTSGKAVLDQLIESVRKSGREWQRIDEVERAVFSELLEMGRLLLEEFVSSAGDGDIGVTLTVPAISESSDRSSGDAASAGIRMWCRLDEQHSRSYVSIPRLNATRTDRTVGSLSNSTGSRRRLTPTTNLKNRGRRSLVLR